MGRGDARPAILKGRIFPLRDRVTIKDIDAGIHGLAAKGCVSLYTVGGKPYFWFPTWSNHQRIRDVKPKYPGPEEADALPQVAADCGGLPQAAALIQSNPIQSESESKSESNAHPRAREAAFEQFWQVYPKKVGKGEARKAFAKAKVPLKTLLESVDRQKQSDQWRKDGGQYIPNPATWLNQGRWEDELLQSAASGKNGAPGEYEKQALAKLVELEGGHGA